VGKTTIRSLYSRVNRLSSNHKKETGGTSDGAPLEDPRRQTELDDKDLVAGSGGVWSDAHSAMMVAMTMTAILKTETTTVRQA